MYPSLVRLFMGVMGGGVVMCVRFFASRLISEKDLGKALPLMGVISSPFPHV